MAYEYQEGKQKIEDTLLPSDVYMKEVGSVYENFYQYKNQRSGEHRQLQFHTFDDYLKKSRELFWNSLITESEDLQELGLEFSLPFVRKEVMDFIGKISSQGINGKLSGEGLGQFGVKVLQGMYKKWRLKSKDKVEKFWQTLYGAVNGTLCTSVSYDGTESKKKYLTLYNPESGEYKLDEKTMKMWNDVKSEIVPIEDIYLSKIWQRDIQKQGTTIRWEELTRSEFDANYGHMKGSEYVRDGSGISEDSLFFQLLGGTGILNTEKVGVLTEIDTDKDTKKVIANGVWLNALGRTGEEVCSPNPFHHKMQPYTWTIWEAIDEKYAYGLSTPFKLKDPHKILNTSYCVTPDTKILTRDLRWVEAGTLQIGDKLIGFDEQGLKNEDTGHRRQRHWDEATVTGTGRRIAPVYKVKLEDGTELKCTGNHRWLVWNGKGHEITWLRTDEMIGRIDEGESLSFPKYLEVHQPKKTYEAGYLGGLFDGEGHMSQGNSGLDGKPSRGMQIAFCQQDNACFEKGVSILRSEGYDINISTREPQREGLESVKYAYIRGGLEEMIRFLSETRPERLLNEGWAKKNLSDMLMKKRSIVDVESVEYIGEMEIVTLESSSKTYIAEGFGAHNTMLVERELRAIDPVILTSDFEAPEIIFGQKRVHNVGDVSAYKELQVGEASGSFFNMMNSLQGVMTSQAQGGNSAIIPSRQPKAAREIIAMENMKQQSLGNTLVMYYDLVYQEMFLMLKTALQFYPTGKYSNQTENMIRSFTVPDMPLTQGGVGNLEVRMVRTPQEALALHFEGVKKSIENGRVTEIIEVPIELVTDLSFSIDDIKLTAENADELERSLYNEQVLAPLIQVFIPAGIASIDKVFVQFCEKNGIHPADYVASENLANLMNSWSKKRFVIPEAQPGQQTGNIMQSMRGAQFGSQSNGGIPAAEYGA